MFSYFNRCLQLIFYVFVLYLKGHSPMRELAFDFQSFASENVKRYLKSTAAFEIKSTRLIFKTETLIHQSKANLDLKICLV